MGKNRRERQQREPSGWFYYRPPDQEELIDEAFFLQLQDASRSQALILLGDFNQPDICWKSNTASCRQSSRFLKRIEDDFLSQVISTPTRGEAILDLVVTNESELVGDVKIRGSLGCSDHALVELTLWREMGIMKSIVRTLNFRRANFQLFKEIDSEKDSLGNGPQGQGNRTELAGL